MLHNFFHNVPPVIGKNEFVFQQAVTDRFIMAMLAFPTEWVRAAFSYLGHYGLMSLLFSTAFAVALMKLDDKVRKLVKI